MKGHAPSQLPRRFVDAEHFGDERLWEGMGRALSSRQGEVRGSACRPVAIPDRYSFTEPPVMPMRK